MSSIEQQMPTDVMEQGGRLSGADYKDIYKQMQAIINSQLYYLGADSITGNGESQDVTLPESGTTKYVDVYNDGDTVGAGVINSKTYYVPPNASRGLPIASLSTLTIDIDSGGSAYFSFYGVAE